MNPMLPQQFYTTLMPGTHQECRNLPLIFQYSYNAKRCGTCNGDHESRRKCTPDDASWAECGTLNEKER